MSHLFIRSQIHYEINEKFVKTEINWKTKITRITFKRDPPNMGSWKIRVFRWKRIGSFWFQVNDKSNYMFAVISETVTGQANRKRTNCVHKLHDVCIEVMSCHAQQCIEIRLHIYSRSFSSGNIRHGSQVKSSWSCLHSVGNNANNICFVECIHCDDRNSSSVVKSIGTIVSLFLSLSPVQFVSCDEKKKERQWEEGREFALN